MTIENIKQFLRQNNLKAYIVSYGNCFIGQDILKCEHKLQHLCGFSGSDGLLIITLSKVFLLIDGRYELQAAKQTADKNITLIYQNPTLENALTLLKSENINRIGYDAWCWSIKDIDKAKHKFTEMSLIDVGDLVQLGCHKSIKIETREEKYAGLSQTEKLQIVTKFLPKHQADYLLLTAADSVSWLLNIHASDLPYSPIVRSYALIDTIGNITLFADNLLTDKLHKPLNELVMFLQNHQDKKIICDDTTTPVKLMADNLEFMPDMVQELKAVKNKTELEGMINCHIRDGVAVCRLLMWLENYWQGQTELSVVEKLHELRSEQNLFFSESFATIVGAGSNGAIVHYEPNSKTNKPLQGGQLLLIDSGGQYFDGTTDITRTICIANPNKEEIKHFTLVLKAHIALADYVFAQEMNGAQLDGIARQILRENKLDYKHGTGHGVACFGNVHEGPIRISPQSKSKFEENMVTSIEPGLYFENRYGIRIENLYYTQYVAEGFLRFVSLTKVPIDKRLIDKYMLNADEQKWLNKYHEDVYMSLQQYMTEKEKQWLKKACSPL